VRELVNTSPGALRTGVRSRWSGEEGASGGGVDERGVKRIDSGDSVRAG
jgi:hypothetical protein